MARSVKKVKQPKTKKFWIILSSSIAAGVVAIIVGLLVWYMVANTEPLEIHFTEYTDIKLNYNEVDDLLDETKDNNYKEVFIFVYDDSFVFDEPDCDEDEPEYATYLKYQEAIEEIANLYELVNKANAEDVRTDGMETGFFLVDASISSNSSMVGSEDYDSLTSPAMLGLYLGNGDSSLKFKSTSETVTGLDASGNDYEYTISGGSTVKSFLQTIREIQDYVEFTYGVSLD